MDMYKLLATRRIDIGHKSYASGLNHPPSPHPRADRVNLTVAEDTHL